LSGGVDQIHYQDVNTSQDKGIVGSVIDAAKSAATRVREAFIGNDAGQLPSTDQASMDLGRDHLHTGDTNFYQNTSDTFDSNEGVTFYDKTTTTTSSSGPSTTEKLKEKAYDAKDKLQENAFLAKEKIQDVAHDIRNKTQDTVHDLKNKMKDSGHDTKNQTKDTAHDIKNQAKDIAYDLKTSNTSSDTTFGKSNVYESADGKDTTSLSADSEIASDSNKQRLRDIQEKIKDAAQAPIVMAQTMLAAGRDRIKEAFSGDTTTATTTSYPIEERTTVPDAFSQDYQPASTSESSTTEQAKTKLATTAADVADKAENWIADNKGKLRDQADKAENWIGDNKYKLDEQADKAQNLAADAKYKALDKANESTTDPANDTRYYSSSHSQTY
jgi:gas vesicle protein